MRRGTRLGDGVLDYLLKHDYPGNVRELENMIEQGVALAVDGVMRRDDIIPEDAQSSPPLSGDQRSLQKVVDQAERAAIEAVLREVDGNKEKAAEVLGLSSTTLWRKMKRLNVVWP